MIKTLRITSFLAAILAILFFAFLIVYGIQSDQNAEEYIKSQGVIEKFKADSGSKTQNNNNQAYPLVQQAQAFALIINPPKTPRTNNAPQRNNPGTPDVSSRTLATTPKFKVTVTSINENHPELSSALIDDGITKKWVRPSETYNHMLISEIKDGMVIVKNSETTYEIPIEDKKTVTAAKSARNSNSSARNNSSTRNNTSSRNNSATQKKQEDPVQRKNEAVIRDSSKTTSEYDQEVSNLLEKVKNLGTDLDSDEKSAKIKEFISEFEYKLQDMNITEEEAKKLDSLGKLLQSMQ